MFRRVRPGGAARDEPPPAPPPDRAVRDAAYRLVIAARSGGDPDEISAARADLHRTVDLARRSPAAARRISHARLPELDLFARTIEEHARASLADRPARAKPSGTAKPDGPTGGSPRV